MDVSVPFTLFSLLALVSTKEKAIEFLQSYGILLKERTCECGTPMKLMLGSRDRFRCKTKSCSKEKSLKAGSWIEDCHLTYTQIIGFIYCWSKQLTTVRFCEEEMGISKKTSIDFNNLLREVCAFKMLSEPMQIGGQGKTVEIDETLITRRKYNVGRLKKQVWVFGGICREDNQCFLYVVENRTAACLEDCIRFAIKENSTIISDCWKGYSNISNMGLGYKHLTVNHSTNFVDPETGACTNKVESMWNVAKLKFKKMCGVQEEMVEGYLCEFMYRKRHSNCNIFQSILKDIALYNSSDLSS